MLVKVNSLIILENKSIIIMIYKKAVFYKKMCYHVLVI